VRGVREGDTGATARTGDPLMGSSGWSCGGSGPGPVQTGPPQADIYAGHPPKRGSDGCPDWCSKSGAPVGSESGRPRRLSQFRPLTWSFPHQLFIRSSLSTFSPCSFAGLRARARLRRGRRGWGALPGRCGPRRGFGEFASSIVARPRMESKLSGEKGPAEMFGGKSRTKVRDVA
jgi:hypothetical protein